MKKGVLRYFTKFLGKHLSKACLMPKACNFKTPETLAQVFSCKFGETSKNMFFTKQLWGNASNPGGNFSKVVNYIDNYVLPMTQVVG